jgi:hypothetical protein
MPNRSEPNSGDADLVQGILDALKMGESDVARVLAAQLEDRHRERAGNVVKFDQRRRR